MRFGLGQCTNTPAPAKHKLTLFQGAALHLHDCELPVVTGPKIIHYAPSAITRTRLTTLFTQDTCHQHADVSNLAER